MINTTYCFICFISLVAIISAEDCTTPDGEAGNCVVVQDCPSVTDILTRSQDTIKLFREKYYNKYHCGYEHRYIKVCCPSNPIEILINNPDSDVAVPPDVSHHSNLQLLSSQCGKLSTGRRITHGQKTDLFDFPWMALIGYKNIAGGTEFKCGATVINDQYVLTAAHCLIRNDLAVVRVGEHDLRTEIDCQDYEKKRVCAPKYQDLVIEDKIIHPEYDRVTRINDIGLIRVSGMKFEDNVSPICLPLGESRNYAFNEKVTVTGFGRTENFTGSPDLLKVVLDVFPLKQCKEIYADQTTISQKQLCAGGMDEKDSCSGDSGGPLQTTEFIDGDVRYVQQGVVSFGTNICGEPGFPGVYTKTAFYMQWILDNLKP